MMKVLNQTFLIDFIKRTDLTTVDRGFWKRLYQHKWSDGKRRVFKVMEMISSWGFKISPFGFLTISEKYSKFSPKEKGIPDLKIFIFPKPILLEVTGTKALKGSGIWVRPDKFQYASRHPEQECWLAHIVENNDLIRFMRLRASWRFPLIHPSIRGTAECYKNIPEDHFKSSDFFKNYLLSRSHKNA